MRSSRFRKNSSRQSRKRKSIKLSTTTHYTIASYRGISPPLEPELSFCIATPTGKTQIKQTFYSKGEY